MSEVHFDAEAAKGLVALYVTPDVVAQRDEFREALAPRRGERILDVGSGPGFLAASIAEATGPEGRVSGIDVSEPLLEVAKRHCAHLPWVDFRWGDAVRLPFADAAFDAAISTQVLEYVRDVDAALVDMHRVLEPGGRAVIVDTDWDSIVWASGDRARMARVLEAWEAHAADVRLPRTLAGRLERAGFRLEAQRVLPLFNPRYDPETYSNRIIDMVVRFVARKGGIAAAEAQAWADDLREGGRLGRYFFSLNRYLFVARKPATR